MWSIVGMDIVYGFLKIENGFLFLDKKGVLFLDEKEVWKALR